MPVMQERYARECGDSCAMEDGEVACLVLLEGAGLGVVRDFTGRDIYFHKTQREAGVGGEERASAPAFTS